ncbi:MAG: glutamine--fructose-6-phosphate transaminase (isomerizing) [Oscillospiraceae bacterium]|nr:glutamine--fructose-6-phosphate transaminase (isomerizing) [Oscillospiraceae bacterium]
MCGIIGYAGLEEAAPILLDGLERLEYRGYDSAGVAIFTKGGSLLRVRAAGRLTNLHARVLEQLKAGADLHGEVGIGHTRWATHGEPTEENAHPHRSANGKYMVVHNGIIENHAALRKRLQEDGVVFASQTDTEVIAQLLESNDTGDALETMRRTLPQLEGSYAAAILYNQTPDTIYCVRRQSPLLIAMNETGVFLASDSAALLPHSRQIYRLEDGETAMLKAAQTRFYDGAGTEIAKTAIEIARHVTTADRGGYQHFMRKEIDEQPLAVHRTIAPLLHQGTVDLGEAEAVLRNFEDINRVLFLGCGSAYHVGMAGRVVVEEMTGIPAGAELASEFRGFAASIDPRTLVIIVSQSGETADTLMALRLANERGARTLSIVNVEGSSIASESGSVIYTKAGLEVAVATTKAYSTQLAVVYAVAARLAALRGCEQYRLRPFIHALHTLPERLDETLQSTQASAIAWAEEIHEREHAYFIGRNLDYVGAMEGALKLKEISYLHAEAYAAGELKHGTISLIEQGTPVVAVCLRRETAAKTASNVEEVFARGARVFCIAAKPEAKAQTIVIHPTHPLLVTSLAVIPAQLLAYHTAFLRKCDIDKPRSLAKSVTVE